MTAPIIIPEIDTGFLRDTLYLPLAALSAEVPLARNGTPLGVWDAAVRPKVTFGEVDGVPVTRSLRRDAASWTVREETVFEGDDFTATFEQWWSWAYDPAKPFPHASYDTDCGSVWDYLTGDWYSLSITGSLGRFLNYVGVRNDDARQIVRWCEGAGTLTTDDAFLEKLTLA